MTDTLKQCRDRRRDGPRRAAPRQDHPSSRPRRLRASWGRSAPGVGFPQKSVNSWSFTRPNTTGKGRFPIRLEGWLVIAAVILGPILALWAQRYSERRRDERARKLWLFRELMATRTMRLSGRHVGALNHIDLEFNPKKKADANVLTAWKTYLDALSNTPEEDAQRAAARYVQREDYFVRSDVGNWKAPRLLIR